MKRILSSFLLSYLRFFAKRAINKHQPTIIGIAGSVGKSSTRNALYALLQEYFPTKMIYGNSETGIPLGILGITQHGFSPIDWILSIVKAPVGIGYLRGSKYLLVEMGIDDPYPPKNMEYLLTIIKPDIALSLNVSATHTEQFEKVITNTQSFSSDQERLSFLIQAIADEDTKIITQSHCKLGIYNADNTYLTKSLKSFTQTDLETFGKAKDNTIYYKDYVVSLKGTKYSFMSSGEEITISLPFILPKEYQELFAAVILVGKKVGLSKDNISQALEKNFDMPKGRGSIFSGIHNSILIDSSYNASKDAVEAFLSLVRELKKQTKKNIIFLFGDMRELGDESKIEHELVSKEILTSVDTLYCVGPQTKKYVLPVIESSGKQINHKWFATAIDAGEYLSQNIPDGSIILIKGSQNTIFLEEALPFILQNNKDIPKLCRQDAYWLTTKRNYFQTKQKQLFNR